MVSKTLNESRLSYVRVDQIVAFLLFAVVLLTVLFSLDGNCNWGDDYAAYISEGIAIAEGKLDEQAELNAMMHLTALPEKSVGKPLVYVWGYSLLHSLTYKLVGFDRTSYSDVVYYKLPSAFAFAVMAAIFYLYLRRRFSIRTSILLTWLLCMNSQFVKAINSLYSDVLFMALTVTAFWYAEVYINTTERFRRGLRAFLLGVLLWYIYCVRLNGVVVIAAAVFYIAFCLFRRKEKPGRTDLMLPIGFALFFFVFNVCIFPKPSALSSVTDNLSWQNLVNGAKYYYAELSYWVLDLIDAFTYAIFYTTNKLCSMFFQYGLSEAVSSFLIRIGRRCVYFFLVLSAFGMVTEGLRKETHLFLFVIISFVGTSILGLGQGLRYLYPILPYIMMFAAMGTRTAYRALKYAISKLTGGLKKRRRIAPARTGALLCTAYVAIVCLTVAKPLIESNIEKMRFPAREPCSAYSDDALEMYSYIQNNLESDAIIAFRKPRALYLNTGRKAYSPYEENKRVEDAQYYLYYPSSTEEELLITEDMAGDYELIAENSEFSLYKKLTT